MDRVFERLEPLTKVDPQLLYGFIYVCPMNDFCNLIPKVPPFLSVSFAANELESTRTLNWSEVSSLGIQIFLSELSWSGL